MCVEQRDLTSSHKKRQKELVCGQKIHLPCGNHGASEQVLRRGLGLIRNQNGNLENSEETADSTIYHLHICVHALKYTCMQSHMLTPTNMHKIVETSPLQMYTENMGIHMQIHMPACIYTQMYGLVYGFLQSSQFILSVVCKCNKKRTRMKENSH